MRRMLTERRATFDGAHYYHVADAPQLPKPKRLPICSAARASVCCVWSRVTPTRGTRRNPAWKELAAA